MYRRVKVPVSDEAMEINEEQSSSIFVNIFTGYFQRCTPECAPPVSGGVIADEMGLGKTLEVLQLILRNKRPVQTISSPSNETCK